MSKTSEGAKPTASRVEPAPALAAVDVGVAIRGATLLAGVSLAIRPGEVVAVLGPNGAGKSTLLKCLGSELRPTRGTVHLNAKPLADWSPRESAQRRAVLPQHSPLGFPFTALEVVLMGRIPYGGPFPADTEIALAAMAAAEVEHLAARRYTTLSGGERQRVHLARVLTQIWEPLPDREPRYLLLDEPTASLDPAHQHGTLTLVRAWARRGVGVAVVLHDLNLAAQYSDRVAVLRSGRLLAIGSPADVLRPPLIAEAFGLPVHVLPHPDLGCPLIVPRAAPATTASAA
jgi:iron complex transport system ATP-binding protein